LNNDGYDSINNNNGVNKERITFICISTEKEEEEEEERDFSLDKGERERETKR